MLRMWNWITNESLDSGNHLFLSFLVNLKLDIKL